MALTKRTEWRALDRFIEEVREAWGDGKDPALHGFILMGHIHKGAHQTSPRYDLETGSVSRHQGS